MGKPTTRVDHLSSPSGEGEYDLRKCPRCGARWVAPQEGSRLSCRVGSVLDNLDITHADFLFPCPVCELPGNTLKFSRSPLDLDVEAVRGILASEGFRPPARENGLNPPGIFDEVGEEWAIGADCFSDIPYRRTGSGRRVTVAIAALANGRLSWVRVSRWRGRGTSDPKGGPVVELPLARRWPTDERTLRFHLRGALAWVIGGGTASWKAAFVNSLPSSSSLVGRGHDSTSS